MEFGKFHYAIQVPDLVSSACVHCVRFRWAKTTILGKLWILWAPVPTPVYRWGPNLVCYSRPMAYAFVPKFVWICLFWNPIFAIFWTSLFGDVDSWRQSDKVEHGYTTTFEPSPIQRHQNSFCTPTPLWRNWAHKLWHWRAWRTDRQAKKTQRFWPPRRRVKSEPHQTWHFDRGPRAHSCTSKTFWGLMHSFAARGRWEFGGNPTPST